MRVRTHANPFNYIDRMKRVDFSTVFPNFTGTLDLEIGFGRGVFIRHYATRFPDRSILGVEVRKPLVDILTERLAQDGLKNIYAVHGTGERAQDVLPARGEYGIAMAGGRPFAVGGHRSGRRRCGRPGRSDQEPKAGGAAPDSARCRGPPEYPPGRRGTEG